MRTKIAYDQGYKTAMDQYLPGAAPAVPAEAPGPAEGRLSALRRYLGEIYPENEASPRVSRALQHGTTGALLGGLYGAVEGGVDGMLSRAYQGFDHGLGTGQLHGSFDAGRQAGQNGAGIPATESGLYGLMMKGLPGSRLGNAAANAGASLLGHAYGRMAR